MALNRRNQIRVKRSMLRNRAWLILSLLLSALVLIQLHGAAPSSADSRHRLVISMKTDDGAMPTKFRLNCRPPSGVVNASKICAKLLNMRNPFRPISNDDICSQIYGSPASVHIRGRWAGRMIDTVINQSNGCQIARWNRLAFIWMKQL